MNPEEHLRALIRSQELMEERGCLSEIGKSFLDGLKAAKGIAFPVVVK